MKTVINFKDFKDVEELEKYINNSNITDVEILNLEKVGSGFLYYNENLENLTVPNLKEVGHKFMFYNKILKNFTAPKLEIVGDCFLYYNENLEKIITPNLKKIGNCFLYNNANLNIYNIKTKIKTVAEKDTIVFKKMRTGEVIQFLLPKGTKFQTHGVKSRAEYLVAIEDVDYKSFYNKKFDKKYSVGDKIEPDYFDVKFINCSHGIHFFFNEEDAMNYEF